MIGFSDGLIKVLDAVCDKFGIAVDWTSKNVLPLVQQLSMKIVNYELWTSVAWIAVGIFTFVFGILCARYEYKNEEKFQDGGEGLGYFICLVGFIFLLLTLLFQTGDIIACLTFPEKVTMDFIQGYIPR